jgi:hypothetical protein
MTDIKTITDARGAEYGDFTDQGVIAQDLKTVVRGHGSWYAIAPHQRESIEMILHKISRIVNGNPNNPDSWLDIEGYARIVYTRLPKGD